MRLDEPKPLTGSVSTIKGMRKMTDFKPVKLEAKGRFIKTLYGYSVASISQHMDSAEKYAQLLSAAPELLANLKGCLGYFEYLKNQPEAKKWVPDDSWFAPLKEAITKAERV